MSHQPLPTLRWHALTTLAAAITLSVSACTPLAPATPQATALNLPDNWSAPQAANSTAALHSQWWQALGDATLNTLVQQALTQNTDVLLAATRVQQAQATLAATDSSQRPQVQLTAGTQASRSLSALGPTHSRNAQPGVQASWELDVWHRLSEQSQAAQAHLQASAADQAAVQLSITATTVQAYIGWRALQEQLRISQATEHSRQQALQLAQDQLRMGYISQLQLTQTQAELESVQQQVAQLQQRLDQQRSTLNLLRGQPAGTPLPSTDAPAWAALQLPSVPASLPSQLLERRPDIARAAYLLAASDHNLQAQRAAFLPQVSLSASTGSLMANALNYNPLTVWSLGGSLLAPLFDGGRLQAQLQTSTTQRDQAAYAYRGVVLQALADVENALTDQAHLTRQSQHARQRRDVLQQSLQLAHDRFTAGYASYLDELDAQRNLYAAELEVVSLRRAELDNRVQLYKALGGGWQKPEEKSKS